MSIINVDHSSSDSKRDDDSCNSLNPSESDGLDYIVRLRIKHDRKNLQLEVDIIKLENKPHEEPRKKAHKRPPKSNKSRKRTPEVKEKTKKCKRFFF